MFFRASTVDRRPSTVGIGCCAAAAAVVLLVSVEMRAQARPDTTLPELAPSEYEITAELEIIFPTLRRQPLTGFNPPPRIFQIPRGRRPYIDEYKQSSRGLPGNSLIQPATPPSTIGVGQNPNNGELIVGVGRYLSREIRGVAAFDLGEDARAHLDLLHDGYESFKPFDDTLGLEAPYKNFSGDAGIEYNLGASTIGVDLGGFSNKYNLYGLVPDTATTNRPDRDGQGFSLTGVFTGGSESALPVVLEVGIGSDRYETTSGDAAFESRENLFDVSAESSVRISGQEVRLDGAIGRRSLEDSVATTSVFGYDAGGDFELSIGESSSLRVGLQVHGYSTSEGHAPAEFESSKVYIAPRIEYRNTIGRGVEVYALNDPVSRHTSQRQIFEMNPFVRDAPLVLPEFSVVNLEGGIVFYRGPLRLAGRGGFGIYENYLFFEADSAGFGSLVGNLFQAQYGEVETYFFGGDIAVAFPGSFSIAITGDWRGATLDPDQEVPYFPSFESGIRATYAFADDRAILQVDGKYVGSRNVDRAGQDQLDGHLDMSALASYYVTPQIGIYARTKSMTGQAFERWAGYPAADWLVMGGMRLRW